MVSSHLLHDIPAIPAGIFGCGILYSFAAKSGLFSLLSAAELAAGFVYIKMFIAILPVR